MKQTINRLKEMIINHRYFGVLNPRLISKNKEYYYGNSFGISHCFSTLVDHYAPQEVNDEVRKFINAYMSFLLYINDKEKQYSYLNDFWSDCKESFPILYKVFIISKIIPISNAEVERTFSHFRNILTDRRRKMTEERLDFNTKYYNNRKNIKIYFLCIFSFYRCADFHKA